MSEFCLLFFCGNLISGAYVCGRYLYQNSLSGTIPTEIGMLTKLTLLYATLLHFSFIDSMNLFFFFQRGPNQNNLTGTIPTIISTIKLNTLQFANNQLCYSVAYNYWAPTPDFVALLWRAKIASPHAKMGEHAL